MHLVHDENSGMFTLSVIFFLLPIDSDKCKTMLGTIGTFLFYFEIYFNIHMELLWYSKFLLYFVLLFKYLQSIEIERTCLVNVNGWDSLFMSTDLLHMISFSMGFENLKMVLTIVNY